jgi:hypothetical protein
MLNPPFIGKFPRSSRSPAVTKGGTIYYPFWLAYATGVLEEAGFNVKLIDAPADGLTIENVIDKVKDFSPRLVVLDTSTPSIIRHIILTLFHFDILTLVEHQSVAVSITSPKLISFPLFFK